MRRRTVLKLGLAGSVVLTAAGGAIALLQPGLRHGRLTESARVVFLAVAPAVLDGSLPTQAVPRRAALDAWLARLDDAVAAFPAPTQGDLSRLLALLASTPGRHAFAGMRIEWSMATVDQVQAALHAMRTSRLALRQQAYHALRDLTNAAYYADPTAWSQLGYPGPREL